MGKVDNPQRDNTIYDQTISNKYKRFLISLSNTFELSFELYFEAVLVGV